MIGFEIDLRERVIEVGFENDGVISTIIELNRGVINLKVSGMDSDMNSYRWMDSELKVGAEVGVKIQYIDRITEPASILSYDQVARSDYVNVDTETINQQKLNYFRELEQLIIDKGLL